MSITYMNKIIFCILVEMTNEGLKHIYIGVFLRCYATFFFNIHYFSSMEKTDCIPIFLSICVKMPNLCLRELLAFRVHESEKEGNQHILSRTVLLQFIVDSREDIIFGGLYAQFWEIKEIYNMFDISLYCLFAH